MSCLLNYSQSSPASHQWWNKFSRRNRLSPQSGTFLLRTRAEAPLCLYSTYRQWQCTDQPNCLASWRPHLSVRLTLFCKAETAHPAPWLSHLTRHSQTYHYIAIPWQVAALQNAKTAVSCLLPVPALSDVYSPLQACHLRSRTVRACKYSGQHLRHDAACTLGLLRWQPLEYSKVCALVLASSARARQF